jgi:hypothetical protein
MLARPSGSAPADDGAPSGMVAFFAGGNACPAGWAVADEAAGRMLVGVSDVNNIGMHVGTPLGDQEDRTHSHTFAAKATIDQKNIAAAGGGNDSAAEAGDVTTSGMTKDARSGLPFTQLIVCKKP